MDWLRLASTLRAAFAGWLLISAVACARDDDSELLVAVAANFAETAALLRSEFESGSNHKLQLVVGSTGMLYAQIRQGAPYDLLLAADQRRPELLEAAGLAVAGSRHTYAVGRLVLWNPKLGRTLPERADALTLYLADTTGKIAIANPELAPYGAAALSTLARLGVAEQLREQIVRGENVGQAFALVATGNAELGFVALSQLLNQDSVPRGSRWEVPARMHPAILQDAILLSTAANKPAAIAFLDFLVSPGAQRIIERRGYGTL